MTWFLGVFAFSSAPGSVYIHASIRILAQYTSIILSSVVKTVALLDKPFLCTSQCLENNIINVQVLTQHIILIPLRLILNLVK